VKFEVSHTADDQLMDALIALHRARWEQMGEPGMIEANRSEAFLREVAKLLASRGALSIFTVRFADRITAILLALCNKTTIFSYLSAFDPQHESLGFGRELLAKAFRYAHETGFRCWNFLRGDEAYKFPWSAQLIAKSRVLISR